VVVEDPFDLELLLVDAGDRLIGHAVLANGRWCV
jgi:hypothetical protein